MTYEMIDSVCVIGPLYDRVPAISSDVCTGETHGLRPEPDDRFKDATLMCQRLKRDLLAHWRVHMTNLTGQPTRTLRAATSTARRERPAAAQRAREQGQNKVVRL